MTLIASIVEYHAEMTEVRHEIHRRPELGFEERRTAAKVAGMLRAFGVDEVVEGIGGTGVVGVLRNGEGPAIALRADMDALPITEINATDHRSTIDGVMHACGHDGHTCMLLGAARYLAATRAFRGTVVCIFQPAEEINAGALAMIEDGLLERFPVEAIHGMHNMAGLPVGQMVIQAGPVLAAINNITIEITAKGGHAGFPHTTTDPIVAGAAIVSALQTVVSRSVAPHDQAVLSITSFQSATDAYNVIPSAVKLKGTVRYLNPRHEVELPKRIDAIVRGTAEAHGVSALVKYESRCRPTINTEREAHFARDVAVKLVGEENVVDMSIRMAGEDFSFFLEKLPGVFAFIGNGMDSQSGHHPEYDFNDEILPIGASYFCRLVEAALPE